MALNLPGAAIRALTEDELKAAKEVLVARAASSSRMAPEKMAPLIAVAAGEWVPAFQVTVQSILEMRTPKLMPVAMPFKEGMAIPPAPTPVKEPFDVWSFPVEPWKGGASPKTALISIQATLEKKDCQNCQGKGSAPCKSCFSRGVVNCEACMGAGSQPCGICKGLSRISCPDCEGTGRIKSGGMTNKTLGPCGSCGGAGKFNCTHCAGGKVDCPTCGNAGKKPCPSCEGKGRMNCAVCGGTTKVAVGMGFSVEYRPQQAFATGMAAPASQEVLDLALSRKSPPASAEFMSEEALRKEVAAADLSERLRAAVEQAAGRLKPAGATVRMGPTKLSVAQGGVWRVTGSFSGHEFIYWIHPESKSVVAEKDPLGDISRKSVETAQAALNRGDWEAALDAARDTLAMDPQHAEARDIAGRWRIKLMRESLLMGLAAGAAGALVSAAAIFGAARGFHRTGPAVLSSILSLAVGAAAALAFLPVARHLFPTKRRLTATLGAASGAVILFFSVTRVGLGWDPVRSADQKALAQEMGEKFHYGVSAVYNESDFAALQGLYDKYKNSRADLTGINNALQAQQTLKNERDAQTREFLGKLDETLASNAFLPDKRAKIADLKEYYGLRNVDTAPADKAMKDIDEQIKRSAMLSRPRPSGRISITPLYAPSARPAAPARRKAAPARKAAAAKAPAKAKAAPKKAAAHKKLKPNQSPVDPKKKKKTVFGGAAVD